MNRPETFLPRVRPGTMEVDRDDDGSSTDCGLIVAWPEERRTQAAAGQAPVQPQSQRIFQSRTALMDSLSSAVEFPPRGAEEPFRASGLGLGGESWAAAVELQTRRRRRREAQAQAGGVRFHEQTDVRLVDLVDDMTAEEIEAMWYTEEDYLTIKKQARATIKYTMLVQKKGDAATDEQRGLARRLCMRGLEHMASSDVNSERRLLKDSVVDAVLTEQDRREVVGDLGTVRADDAIAAASIAASKLARDLATSMGALDSATVLSYGGPSAQKSPLSSSTMTSSVTPSPVLTPSSSTSSPPSSRQNHGGAGGTNFFSNVFSNAAPRGRASPFQHEERTMLRQSVSSFDAARQQPKRTSLGADRTMERNKCASAPSDNRGFGGGKPQRSKSAEILTRLQALRGSGWAAQNCSRMGEANKEWSVEVAEGTKGSLTQQRASQRKVLDDNASSPPQLMGMGELMR